MEHARPGTADVVVTVTAELSDDGEAVAEFYRTKPDSGERRYPLRLIVAGLGAGTDH